MKKNKAVVVKKINKMNLSDIEKRLAKLAGQDESLYYQHLADKKSELEKN